MDELTDAEHLRIEQNRKRALELRLSQVVANDRHDVYASVPQSKLNTKYLSDGGFIFEEETSNHNYPYTEKDEEFSDPELNATVKPKKRKQKCIKQSNAESNLLIAESNVPIPPDQEKPTCDLCHKPFEESFLRKTFEVDVCDKCRDPKNIHALITKSSAKERYLLNDVDLDIREPKLNYLLKRNPHNSSWGDMRLYLEAQIAERALEIWGSEDALEKEREKRLKRNEESKLKSYSKKVKAKDSLTHELTSTFSTDQSVRTDAQLSISISPCNQASQQPHKKWPSFTMKRPVRLGSNSSSIGTKETGTGRQSSASRPIIPLKSGSQDRPVCLARSLSAERQFSNREKLVDSKFLTCDDQTGDDVCDTSVYRKSSQSANSSLKLTNQSVSSKLSDNILQNETTPHLKGGLLKKRNALVNFFSRGKPKHRGKHHQSQHQLVVPSGLQSKLEHEAVPDCTFPNSDDHVCNSEVNLGDNPIISTDNIPNVKPHALEYTTE